MTQPDEGQPPWWKQAVSESLGYSRALPPLWPNVAELPPLALDGRRLSDEQVGELLIALVKSPVGDPLPLVRAVKEHGDAAALDAFASRLCELWLAKGAPTEEKWALKAAGLLGGDGTALKLTPHIREWPGRGYHQRAVLGLECLRAIGSETALMQLSGVAQKVKFPALQRRARQFMGEIARQRGLSEQQLEDRIVPDLGLDERGGRTFDYGPRSFRLVFGPNLKPLLRDEQGKTKSSPPKGTAKDDPAKVEEAARDWKVLKKQVSETVKAQAKRLERAMTTRRRWSRPEFEKYIVGHPFLLHMARLLLWGDYGEDGELAAAFRVTEDRTFADVNDNTYEPVGKSVGIVHPLELSDEERAKWGQVFADYELIAPFPQLGRRVHTLLPGEEGQTELTRFAGPAIPAVVFQGILKQQGWAPARWVGGHYHKPFPEAGVTALVQLDYTGGDTVTIRRALFVPGVPEEEGRFKPGPPLPWGEVDPVTRSEVLSVLAVLASKGTPAP